MMAVATIDGFGFKFSFGPDLCGMVGGFVVALDAGVELTATLMSDSDNIALRMPVSTLGALVNVDAADSDGFGLIHR
jgi:hypothetical protein